MQITKTVAALLSLTGTLTPLAAQDGIQSPGLRVLQGMEPDDSELDLRTTPVVRAVQRAQDSVVSIYVLANEDRRGTDRSRSPQRNLDGLQGQGSGVVIDADGLVITNWHVIANVAASPDKYKLRVAFRDDRAYDATLISSSPENDLALLQLALPKGIRVQPARAGRSSSLMVGETVIAIGNPEGRANTVTVGVLSATDRSIAVRGPDGRPRRYEGLLQTDAAINRGNSGGALLDITGKLIGINNAMAVGVENIGFAIPVDTVERVFKEQLLSTDGLSTVWIGARIGGEDSPPRVNEVEPQGPASAAGLRVGDLVTSIDGREIETQIDVGRALTKVGAGNSALMTVRRGSESIRLSLPVLTPSEAWLSRLAGVQVSTIRPNQDPNLLRAATAAFFQGRRRVNGVLPAVFEVRSVTAGLAAARIGIEPGDVLVGTSRRSMFGSSSVPFGSLENLVDAVRDAQGSRMEIFVFRDGEILEGILAIPRR